MTFDGESLARQIPAYLSAGEKETLVAELKAFFAGGEPDYFLSPYFDRFREAMLQGDGWHGFEIRMFDSGDRRPVRGVILSNSCDVDPANSRTIPSRIVFAPLVRLSKYKKVLDESGIEKGKIDSKIDAITSQRTTNMFYIPPGESLEEACVVRLDDVYSAPIAALKDCKKIFTLSMVGFYIFVLKLSIHFCRLQENISRHESKLS